MSHRGKGTKPCWAQPSGRGCCWRRGARLLAAAAAGGAAHMPALLLAVAAAATASSCSPAAAPPARSFPTSLRGADTMTMGHALLLLTTTTPAAQRRGAVLRQERRVGPKTDDSVADDPFAWIRSIESGPTGRKITLKASTVYELDRQYQLPRGTELVGAGGTDPASRTVIRAVGKNYSYNCGPNATNRKGLVLGDDTLVRGLHLIGMETKRMDCLSAMIGAKKGTPLF